MAHREEPGLSIGIVHDQELVWARGFGYADVNEQVAATAATRYRIASITKLFTSTGILMLRDAEKLQLDDPVEQHLPWFNIRQRFPDAPAITVRHLLTHTAGLPREAGFPYWTDADFPTREQVREALPRQENRLPCRDPLEVLQPCARRGRRDCRRGFRPVLRGLCATAHP